MSPPHAALPETATVDTVEAATVAAAAGATPAVSFLFGAQTRISQGILTT